MKRFLVAGLAATLALACGETASAPVSNHVSLDAAAAPTLDTIFGPEQFTRGTGAPDSFARVIPTGDFEAPFVLHVSSGDANGANAVASATVTVDGAPVLSPSDFNRHAAVWSIPVALGAAARLGVTLAGAPGSALTLWLEGRRTAAVFCPDGASGAFTTLAGALAAVHAGGTVFVCDGTHAVDQVHVNKPVTLRSLHPASAVLEDADSSAFSLQNGHPALVIDSVPSGVVRIADLGFAPRGRAIFVNAAFDQVDIDSCRFVARDSVTALGVEVGASLTVGARVNVSSSAFDGGGIGVFPVGPVEVNVRGNVFNDFTVAGPDFSGMVVNGTLMGAFGSVEDNIITGCRRLGCIRLVGNGAVHVAHNRIQASVGVAALGGILRNFSSTLTSIAAPDTIEDNDIVGAATGLDPTTISGWTLQAGVTVTTPAGVQTVVQGNRISQVHTGVVMAGDVAGQDNVVNSAMFLFRQTATRSVTFRRNDGTSLLASFQAVSSGGNYQCNWWGTASGPLSPPGNVALATYTPFSVQPIAGRPSVSCP